MYWDTLLLVLTLWCAAAALLGAHPAHICTGTGLRRYAFSVPFEMVFLPDDYHAPLGMKALEYSALPPPARSSDADTAAVGICWAHPCHIGAGTGLTPADVGMSCESARHPRAHRSRTEPRRTCCGVCAVPAQMGQG
jgi:hypothetical protein